MTDGHSPSLLIVDDEADLVSLLCARLGRRGFRTEGAGTASAALQLMTEHGFTLVVCDIHLGLGSGIDFFRRTRAQGFVTPFIFLSGSGGLAGYRAELGGDHLVSFLQKPIDFQELLHTIRRYVTGAAAS